MANFAGIGSRLDAAQIEEQRRQDEKERLEAEVTRRRDAAHAEAERERATHVWEDSVFRHVRDLLILFADPYRGKDTTRNLVFDQLRSNLAHAVSQLWPG